MRALPSPSRRPLGDGPTFFVDPVRGDDAHNGSLQSPWKTLEHATSRLRPGDTLCLRGGVYFEAVSLSLQGTAEKPITIRAYPGELAILDAGWREFQEAPRDAWEPVPDGAPAEYRSRKSYPFGGGFGNFADSMIPFHRYMNFADLRSTNELYRKEVNNRQDDPVGIYCGPGVRRDPQTGRIHVRLDHTRLPGLGNHAYTGPTDARKLPLIISGHDVALRIEGARHLRVWDLVVRGAQRTALAITRDQEDITQWAEDIELDGVTLYGSGSAIRADHCRRVRLTNSALRGHSAPWHSRFTVKNRAHSGYQVTAEVSDMEIAHCELTDHHDCFYFYGLEGLRFHHNLVDNFNDDGLEPGPKKKRGVALIYQNVILRTLSPFTAHASKPVPVEAEPGSGVYVFRNVVDLRRGTYSTPPETPDPSGAYLDAPTTLVCHNHGSPVHAVYYVYHNTFLLPGDAFHGYYGFTWGSYTRLTTRRVFNNIFVQVRGLPGVNFTGASAEDDFQADGNLLWGVEDGPVLVVKLREPAYFDTFRKSPLFEASKRQYAPGWGAHDVFADPRFVGTPSGAPERQPESGAGAWALSPADVRLQRGSPAVDAGVTLPKDWPDPLREFDAGPPDIGALPLGAEPLRVGPNR